MHFEEEEEEEEEEEGWCKENLRVRTVGLVSTGLLSTILPTNHFS